MRPRRSGRTGKEKPLPDLERQVIAAWETNGRVTEFLIGHIPAPLWNAPLPGSPRRTVRSLAAHIHNARCSWIRTLGEEFGIVPPRRVDQRNVTQRELVGALKKSARGIGALLDLGCRRGGRIPASRAYVWRNLPLDVPHVLAYFVAHEAHHRGQIVMAARLVDSRLPARVSGGLWQFRALSRGSAALR